MAESAQTKPAELLRSASLADRQTYRLAGWQTTASQSSELQQNRADRGKQSLAKKTFSIVLQEEDVRNEKKRKKKEGKNIAVLVFSIAAAAAACSSIQIVLSSLIEKLTSDLENDTTQVLCNTVV